METALTLQQVRFNNDSILATQDLNGDIWAVISSICDNIGFSASQRDSQVVKVQNDELLREASKKLSLKFQGQVRNAICIEYDYVPLWLAKISITKKMKKDDEYNGTRVVENLKIYQLKAKDVLADHFLNHKNHYEDGFNYDLLQQMFEQQNNMLSTTLSTFTNTFTDAMNEIMNQHSKSMQNFSKLVFTQSKPLTRDDILPKQIITHTPIPSLECKDFKKRVYTLCDEIVDYSDFENSKSVLSHTYKLINRKYGICWDQETKEYKENNNLDGRPALINVIANSDEGKYLKSILLSVLEDMSYKYKEELLTKKEITEIGKCINEIRLAHTWEEAKSLVVELARQLNDNSPYFIVTYQKLYRLMDKNNNINWANHKSYYKRMHNIRNRKFKPTKKVIIENSPKLQGLFIAELNSILQEVG